MAIIEGLMENTRTVIRDFPKFFSTTAGTIAPNLRTFDLPHSNVTPAGLSAWVTNGTDTADGVIDLEGSAAADDRFLFALDERNGLVRITAVPTNGFPANGGLNVEGYYYGWLSDKDLKFHVTNVIAEHQYGVDGWTVETVSDVEADIIALGSAIDALFALMVEFARDIDINTPEAISLPVSQRFRQMEQLLVGPGGLMERYKEKSHMLNVGLDRIQMIMQRRVSYTTNRLVPLYTPREYDDISRPERQFPKISRQAPTTPPPGFVPARRVGAGAYAEYYDTGAPQP